MEMMLKFFRNFHTLLFKAVVLCLLTYVCVMLNQISRDMPDISDLESDLEYKLSDLQSEIEDMSQEISRLRSAVFLSQ